MLAAGLHQRADFGRDSIANGVGAGGHAAHVAVGDGQRAGEVGMPAKPVKGFTSAPQIIVGHALSDADPANDLFTIKVHGGADFDGRAAAGRLEDVARRASAADLALDESEHAARSRMHGIPAAVGDVGDRDRIVHLNRASSPLHQPAQRPLCVRKIGHGLASVNVLFSGHIRLLTSTDISGVLKEGEGEET